MATPTEEMMQLRRRTIEAAIAAVVGSSDHLRLDQLAQICTIVNLRAEQDGSAFCLMVAKRVT